MQGDLVDSDFEEIMQRNLRSVHGVLGLKKTYRSRKRQEEMGRDRRWDSEKETLGPQLCGQFLEWQPWKSWLVMFTFRAVCHTYSKLSATTTNQFSWLQLVPALLCSCLCDPGWMQILLCCSTQRERVWSLRSCSQGAASGGKSLHTAYSSS